MGRLLKYAIFLALALAIGFYIIYGPLTLEDFVSVPVKPKAPVARASSASFDEELDYMVAKRLASLEGWRAFLAAHASGAYAQSARAEIERRFGAENASAPAAAEVSNAASPDATAVSEAAGPGPPSPGTEVAALTPDEVCKRDEDRLERLRRSPSAERAASFAIELGCERLWPQLQGLIESLGHPAPARAAAGDSNGASSPYAAAPAPPSDTPDQNVDVARPTILAGRAPIAADGPTALVVAGLPTLAPVRVVLKVARDDAGRSGRAADIKQALVAAGLEVADLVPIDAQRPGPSIGYYFQSDRNAAVGVSHLLEPLLGAVDPVVLRMRASMPEPGTIEIAIPHNGFR